MSVDDVAVSKVQDRWAKTWGEYRDISIRTVLEYYFDALKETQQPVELTDQNICDIVAIFNNPTSPKIKCEDCNGNGHIDVEDEDGYLGRCDECDGYGYTHFAVNQAERVKQVREHVLSGITPKRESGCRVKELISEINKIALRNQRESEGHAFVAFGTIIGLIERYRTTNQIEDGKPV